LLQTIVEPDGTTIVLDDGLEPPPLLLLQAATLITSEVTKTHRKMVMRALYLLMFRSESILVVNIPPSQLALPIQGTPSAAFGNAES
jgi:hypothetical protein